jgi:hypothetical protein
VIDWRSTQHAVYARLVQSTAGNREHILVDQVLQQHAADRVARQAQCFRRIFIRRMLPLRAARDRLQLDPTGEYPEVRHGDGMKGSLPRGVLIGHDTNPSKQLNCSEVKVIKGLRCPIGLSEPEMSSGCGELASRQALLHTPKHESD